MYTYLHDEAFQRHRQQAQLHAFKDLQSRMHLFPQGRHVKLPPPPHNSAAQATLFSSGMANAPMTWHETCLEHSVARQSVSAWNHMPLRFQAAPEETRPMNKKYGQGERTSCSA
jgi:hypothetical protein